MHCAAKHQNPILGAISPVPQNLYIEYLNQFYIFLARKYASFGHSAYCRNHFGRFSHLRAKYGKSPQKILLIFTYWQHKILTECFDLVFISFHNGNYRMIPLTFVIIGTLYGVYCFVSMLMTSCFVVDTPTSRRKRITKMEPYGTITNQHLCKKYESCMLKNYSSYSVRMKIMTNFVCNLDH